MNNILNVNSDNSFKPNISYLKVYSCRAYVTITLEDRVKSYKIALRA